MNKPCPLGPAGVGRVVNLFSGPAWVPSCNYTKSALTHHPQAGGGTAFGSRALSEGDCAFCGKRPPMPSGIDGATGEVAPASSPVASENLPLAAFRCLPGTLDEGRETKDGGNKNWQFIIWRQRLSAEGQAAPLSRRQPI